MTTKHWQFNDTDSDLKDYGRNKPNGIISKVQNKFTVNMLPNTYVNYLTLTKDGTTRTLYEYMDYIKGL